MNLKEEMKTVDEIFGTHFNGLHYDDITKEGIIKFAEDYVKQSIPKITKMIDKVNNEHPYKEVGNRDSYSEYNQGWEDACDRIKTEILATEVK